MNNSKPTQDTSFQFSQPTSTSAMFGLQIHLLVLFSILVAGWLPADKGLFERSRNGNSGLTTSVSDGSRSPDKLRQRAWLPSPKIRGVNLGSYFVMEPWMSYAEWYHMGCGSYEAESDCVQALGSDVAQAFLTHWDTWISKPDLARMHSYGINTIRVPIGWWMDEALVNPGEYFPKGAVPYLERVCEWAAESGFFVIIDLHALPGGQVANNSFAGQIFQVAEFYQTSQYQRAYNFLAWITTKIHTETAFRNVGMLEVANEPLPDQPTLLSEYYPGALQAIRNTEASLGVPSYNALTVQFMDTFWGAGNPQTDIPGNPSALNIAFDDHFYLSKSTQAPNQDTYISWICQKQYTGDSLPVLTGEWSLAVNNSAPGNFSINPGVAPNDFYRQYWAAQVQLFEKNLGWIFWSWKTNLTSFQWDYQKAVAAGVISMDPSDALTINACNVV